MNKLLAILLVGAMLAPSAGLTHSHKRKSLEIVHPYTMETTKGTTTARVFMTIKNSGGAPERLISAPYKLPSQSRANSTIACPLCFLLIGGIIEVLESSKRYAYTRAQ
jgi:hypothetical protein